MGFRRLRADQRGGLTIEHVVIGGVVVALVAGLVAVVSNIPVPEAVSVQVCRVAATVTGQACTELADASPDAPPDGGDGPDTTPQDPDAPAPGEEEAPDGQDQDGDDEDGQDVPVGFPQTSDCLPTITESWHDGSFSFPLHLLPIGGRLGGRYTTEITERANGQWDASTIWYGEAAATLQLGAGQPEPWAGPQGRYVRTWTVDTREEAEQIAREQLGADIDYLRGQLAADVVSAGAGLAENVADATGLGGVFDTVVGGIGDLVTDEADENPLESEPEDDGDEEPYDPGRPQVHSVEVGGTAGFVAQPNLFEGLVAGARANLRGRIWNSVGYQTNSASDETTIFLETRGVFPEDLAAGFRGTGFRIPGGVEMNAYPGVRLRYGLNAGLVFDQASGRPTHLDVTFSLQGTGVFGLQGGARGRRPEGGGRPPGITISRQEGGGGRVNLRARVPLGPGDQDIGRILEWLEDPVGPTPSIQEVLTDENFVRDFTEQITGRALDALNTTATMQLYENREDVTRAQVTLPGDFRVAYLGLNGENELTDAYVRRPGGDWLPWTACGG